MARTTTLTYTCASTYIHNTAQVINATGAGILSFIGGGVGIFSGVTWNANLGALSHFGSGIMLFNGGACALAALCPPTPPLLTLYTIHKNMHTQAASSSSSAGPCLRTWAWPSSAAQA